MSQKTTRPDSHGQSWREERSMDRPSETCSLGKIPVSAGGNRKEGCGERSHARGRRSHPRNGQIWRRCSPVRARRREVPEG
jgi:hypothetical protein